MAAILPHLAEPDETTPIERAFDRCTGSLNGLGDAGGSCPAPDTVVADAHAGLLGMTFVREAVAQSLVGKSFDVRAGNAQGKDPRTVYLVLDEPIGPGPAWNPATNPSVRQYGLLSWTSKMNCPSWSIPAGVPQIGGTCPGAMAGQSVMPEEARRATEKHVLKVLGQPTSLAKAICNRCYATGGQYSTGQVQFAQLLRHYWAVQALEAETFVPTMIYAVENANYRLDGGTIKEEREERDPETGEVRIVAREQKLPPEPSGKRFFRIHDSGDFFSPAYLEAWKQVARALPDITFWAPTRIWATSWGQAAVNGSAKGSSPTPANLIIRPSAYDVEGPAPTAAQLGAGWAAGTVVINVKNNQGMSADREAHVMRLEHKPTVRNPTGTHGDYTWDCRAYATEDQGHTCRKAVAPPGLGGAGGKGCRACWVAPAEIVNYSLH